MRALPLRNCTARDTDTCGGIDTSTCTWSRLIAPAQIVISRLRAISRKSSLARPDVPYQDRVPVLRNPHQVVYAVPYCTAAALVVFHAPDAIAGRPSRRLKAHMDAPTLPSDQVVLTNRNGLHPYIRTFARDWLAVPDGFRWSTPYRGGALGVLRLYRVSPTTV